MRPRPFFAGLCLVLLTLSAVASAQQPAPALELTLRTDRPEALYAPKEPAEFLIQVRQGGTRLAGGTVSVELSNDGFKPLGATRSLNLDDQGRASLSGTPPEAGFLQCRVTVKNGDQSTSGLVAAGFSPEKIVPAAKLPDTGHLRDDLVEAYADVYLDVAKPYADCMAALIAEAMVNPDVRQLIDGLARGNCLYVTTLL